MKNATKLLSLILSLTMLLGAVSPALAQEREEWDGEIYSAVVCFEEDADVDTLCKKLEALPGISVRWRYSALFRGAAIQGTRAALALAGESAGVRSLSLSRTWAQTDVINDPINASNSLDVMNGADIPYDGDGMVIAVLDSGLKTTHETFADYGIMDDIRITEDVINQFVSAGGTDGRYLSAKVPFAYDYAGRDRSVHTADRHGTHVSALAVGYAERANGTVKFRGVAPAAQLLCMKVFPDNADQGADDADILKAMEDAYLLGADVINLSLGMSNAFEGDEEIGAVYTNVVAMLEKEGVIVCCAVGNSGTSLTGKAGDTALPGGGYTDYGTAGAPAIYDGAEAIAAVNSAFYEAGGGLIAGERTIVYTEAVAGTEGLEPPDITILAGRTLEYVVIDGLGTADDFEGFDLTDCAALVQRGEIYFSEKINNAAAAGAALCIIYNNEPGTIIAAADGVSIPCVVITQEDGEYLIRQAMNGRGELMVAPEQMMISTGEKPEMFTYSSWGGSSTLRLVPTLSAPGGTILSAGVETNRAYVYLSGTSMAAPNASGAYAVVLQALRERGIEDRAERARMAKALLESTAQLVTNENGVPLSPRRQGAGVIDLYAALTTETAIEEPLLELGENELGRFTLTFKVRNLTGSEKQFDVRSTVLTDAFDYVENTVRSTLEPLDITGLVEISGAKTIDVAPMGETTVSLTLQIPLASQKLLKEAYPDGFYTEGYVVLTDESGETVHATFLGYCGDWEAAPIIEQVDFRDVMNAYYAQSEGEESAVSALTVNMGYNLALLCGTEKDTYGALIAGENPWLMVTHNDARIAMSSHGSDAIAYHGDCVVIDLYTLRNAEHIIMVVSDRETGEIYKVDDRAYLPCSLIPESMGSAAPTAQFVWDGTDSEGKAVPGGTAVTVAFYAWLETEREISDAYKVHAWDKDYSWLIGGEYENYMEWGFPMVIDAASPVIGYYVNERLGTVEIIVTDEHYVAYAAVQNEAGDYLAEQAFAETRAGVRHGFSVPLSECGGMLYITAVDYAGNMVGYEIDFVNGVQPLRCAVAMLSDVKKDAWYHEAVDFAIEHGLMDIGQDMTFSPEAGALRVQVLEMLYDLAGRPVATAGLPFTDVPAGASYRGALEWAYSLGIVTGYDAELFGAYAPLQRSHLAVMLYRAAQAAGEITDSAEVTFADTAPDWAAGALAWAVEKGFLTTDAEGNINASSYVTRGEFAYLLMNYYINQ